MPKYEGVLHFTIPVKDLDRSEKFYTEVLDFKKIDRRGPIVFMRAGDNHFNLTYSENPITLNAVGRHEIHSAFRLTPQEYDEALKVLPSRGVEIFKQPRHFGVREGGAVQFMAVDHARGHVGIVEQGIIEDRAAQNHRIHVAVAEIAAFEVGIAERALTELPPRATTGHQRANFDALH